jgi:hypothetical protein
LHHAGSAGQGERLRRLLRIWARTAAAARRRAGRADQTAGSATPRKISRKARLTMLAPRPDRSAAPAKAKRTRLRQGFKAGSFGHGVVEAVPLKQRGADAVRNAGRSPEPEGNDAGRSVYVGCPARTAPDTLGAERWQAKCEGAQSRMSAPG